MKKFAIIIGAVFMLAALPGVALAGERDRDGRRGRGDDREGRGDRDGRVVVTTPAPQPARVVIARGPIAPPPAIEARGHDGRGYGGRRYDGREHSGRRYDGRFDRHNRCGFRYVPGHWEERVVSVYVPGYYREDVVPAVFETRVVRRGVVIQVMVKPACTVRTWVPGRYENRCEKFWVPGHMVRIR